MALTMEQIRSMTPEQVAEALATMQAKVDTMQRQRQSALSVKVARRGGISVYGLQRTPVTLYQEQWEKVYQGADPATVPLWGTIAGLCKTYAEGEEPYRGTDSQGEYESNVTRKN